MVQNVAIAGAGIGGLTLAVALRRRGIEAVVLESAPELAPLGAGLALQPNAMRALASLGIDQAVRAAGAAIARAAVLDQRGRLIGAEHDVAAMAALLGAPTVAVHRARLHQVLLDALGAHHVRLGARVTGLHAGADRVEVEIAGGTTVTTELLVGADGLRSMVRAQLLGDGEPRYAGYTSWRGVTQAGAVPPLPRMSESWGHGLRFGMVDIGHGETYWFAVANAPAQGRDGDVKAELLARFGDWHAPVRALIEATPPARILRTDICDRPPVRSWHRGRVVLLGDAAHPMTPNLGQGACQAVEDAVVLADRLAAEPDLERALLAYEGRRVPRANGMVTASRRFGAVAQWGNPLAVGLRNAGLRLVPASVAASQLRKTLDFRL
jgi:2-polyprenyl-6-methoxyphenol hydroxylase-like FAD-dependent oxidoreductase